MRSQLSRRKYPLRNRSLRILAFAEIVEYVTVSEHEKIGMLISSEHAVRNILLANTYL